MRFLTLESVAGPLKKLVVNVYDFSCITGYVLAIPGIDMREAWVRSHPVYHLSVWNFDEKSSCCIAANLDDIVFRIKEGACYQLQLNFYVQREIVTGMRYCHKVSRGPMTG